jgi:hypothetical protein
MDASNTALPPPALGVVSLFGDEKTGIAAASASLLVGHPPPPPPPLPIPPFLDPPMPPYPPKPTRVLPSGAARKGSASMLLVELTLLTLLTLLALPKLAPPSSLTSPLRCPLRDDEACCAQTRAEEPARPSPRCPPEMELAADVGALGTEKELRPECGVGAAVSPAPPRALPLEDEGPPL